MVLMVPQKMKPNQQMVVTGVNYTDGPSPYAYPRGNGYGVPMEEGWEALPIGKGEILRHGDVPHSGIRLDGLPSHAGC